MEFSVFSFIVCVPSHSCCGPPAGLPCRFSFSAYLHRLRATLHSRFGVTCSQTGSCSPSFSQTPVVQSFSRHSPFGLCASVLSPDCLTMVRHRMRSRHGGNRGGHARPQTAPAVAQPVHNVSPPSSQAPSPASSPDRNHFPHNAFQSTHFKFQSRLNQPIITVNITIIFSEEESMIRPPASNSVEHPQGVLRGAASLGSGQTSADDGKVEGRGASHAEEENPSASQTPGGNPPAVNVSTAFAASSSGTRPGSGPPDGSGLGDMERDGVNWHDYACPVIKEQLDQDIPM